MSPEGPNKEPELKSQKTLTKYDFDLFVVGGGSGGVSTARHAVKYGAKVGVADFVAPTPSGGKWGLGGTCVNVGCIPKKMMHYTALLAEARDDLNIQGWDIDKKQTFNWGKLQKAVQSHIKSLNYGYKTDLTKLKIKYYNCFATFVDKHTVSLDNGKGKIETVTADKIVIATGGRPVYPDIPGAKEYGITSDDLFYLKSAPGKTLVVGASYVALECAGFLTAFGYDTSVMVRSIFLRGFDQQMADRIAKYMQASHTKFIYNSVPKRLEKLENGKIKVVYDEGEDEKSDEYDTVLFAIGRNAMTKNLNLEATGVKAESNGKLKVNPYEQTNVPNIYAVGDVQYGRLELTPTAIMGGALLAQRLFNKSKVLMDYDNVPTTVFTPLEYGTVGLSEEEAIARHTEKALDIYHTQFKPLEWAFNKVADRMGYVKVIVLRKTNKIIGFHILCP